MTSRIMKIVGRSQRATLLLVILIATVLMVGSISIVIHKSKTSATRKINYSDLYKIAEIGSAASVIIENDSLTVKSTDGSVFQATVAGDCHATNQFLIEPPFMLRLSPRPVPQDHLSAIANGQQELCVGQEEHAANHAL